MDSGIESTESSNGSISDSCTSMVDVQIEENRNPSTVGINMEETAQSYPQNYQFREPCSVSPVSSFKIKLKKNNKINSDLNSSNVYTDNSTYSYTPSNKVVGDIILPEYFSSQNYPTFNSSESLSQKQFSSVDSEEKSDLEVSNMENESNKPMQIPRAVLPKLEPEVSIPIYTLKKFQVPSLPSVPEGCCLKLNFPKIETEVVRPQEQAIPFESFSLSFANGPLQINCNPQPYTGSLAVLPYESRELQRKFKHYRNRLRQIISTKPKERKLRTACSLNNVELVDRLLKEGVDPKAIDEKQRTALHIAASKGYTNIVKMLLQCGADPNQKDSVGNTALHLAACTSHIETVTLLLKAGTDVKQPDNQGYSPLHLAYSRLTLLQKDLNPSSHNLRQQVYEIIEMMQEFLKSSGATEEAELLSALTNQLTLSDSGSKGESDIMQLLNSLQDLTLSKRKKE